MRSLPLTVLGAYHLVLGGLMALAPRRFFEDLATYGAYNDHYIRDLATFNLALGAVMLAAATRRAWQVPILVFAVAQYALHIVNHLIDIGDTEPAWLGPFNAAGLVVVGGVLWWLLRGTRQTGAQIP